MEEPFFYPAAKRGRGVSKRRAYGFYRERTAASIEGERMNKLTKLLSVFVIAGALGAGVAGAVGCNKGNDHTHNYIYTQNDDGTHSAGCDGCDEKIDHEAHTYGSDGKCACGAEKATGVTITNTETEIYVNNTLQLTASVTPAGASVAFKWEIVSGAKYATVEEITGKITGVKAGKVTVRVTAGGVSAEKEFNVNIIPLQNVTLDTKYVPLKPGETFTLAPEFTPENASNKKIEWTSSDTAVATVDGDGKITAVADGTATISGVSEEGGKKLSCSVEVDKTFVDTEYEVNITEKFEAVTTDTDRRSSIVTVGAGTEVRNRTKSLVYKNEAGGEKVSDAAYEKSVKLAGGKIVITVPAAGTLTLHVQNGSSGTTSGWVPLTLTKKGGSSQSLKYAADDGSPIRELVVELTSAGEYTLTRVEGTTDVYYVGYTCRVKETPLESISVTSTGNDKYFVGQTYSYDSVQLDKVYSVTGRTEALDIKAEGVTVDASKVDTAHAGVYPVTVKYNDGTKDYVAEPFNVTVYAVDSLTISTDKIIKGANTAANNGTYINHHLRELYLQGGTFSEDGMTVTVNASVGEGADRKEEVFIIQDGYTVSGYDLSKTGKQTVTVTLDGTTVTQTFEIYVIGGIEDLSAATTVSVKVEQDLADSAIGTKDGSDYQFKTIQQALEFLESCNIPASASKILNIGAGTYNEKLEITVPNLTIIGAGAGETLIEYDSLYGIKDAGGFTHTTDSTATLNIRETAVGFTMRNVTVSNWYNSEDRFTEKLGAGYSEHRALAMLVQADKVVVENCTLLGYQDTLELFTGRHVFRGCLIKGTTDFIFGTNGTTYFDNCEINSISTAKNENGGYITAFKGLNKGDGDTVIYGAIFDNCNFTCEDGVADGKTAIGRTWGVNSAVMVMNSTLGKHISLGTGAARNDRYVNMNGAPEDARFTEYNNTGDGAISESRTGVTVLTDAAAAGKYADFATIFGKTNGKVTYADVWNGEAGAKNN